MAGTPVRSVGEPVPARGTRLGVVSGAVLGRSLELQEKGFGEKLAHPRRIEPRRGAGCSDEGDGPAHAELVIQIAELSREARQGIEDMRQAHQEVVAPHGIPVEGKGMLVVVALVLFDEEARFDAPAVAGAEIATLMNVLAAERLAGEPGVACRFGHAPGLLIDPLPAFLTDDHVQLEPATTVRTVSLFDVIDPAEVLLASSPVLLQGL